MNYDPECERIDVALRAIVALVKRPRKGNGWAMLEELGVSREDAETALTYWIDSDVPLHTDDDFAALLLLCPTLLSGALNMLGRYAEMCGASRTKYYSVAKGRRVA